MRGHWETIERERLAFADLLDTLVPQQWEASSLCTGWTVADVVTHLALTLDGRVRDLAREAVRARGDLHAANQALVRQASQRPRSELVETIRRRASSRVRPPGLGSRAPLVELLLHRLDVVVPLGLTLERPAEPWGPALDFLVSPVAQVGFAPRGRPRLGLAATDLPWTHGGAPQVVGPAAAVAQVLAGRAAGLACLSGPGVPTLTEWVRR